MEYAYKKIFWGLFIATFSITIGFITLLPTFIGWIVVLNGLSDFKSQISDRHFSTVYWSVIALILLSFGEGVITFLQLPDFIAAFPLLFYPVILAVIEMTALHKLLEASADRFEENNQSMDSTEFNKKDKIYLLLMGSSLILLTGAIFLNHSTLLFITLVFTIIIRVYVLTVIYTLSTRHLDIKRVQTAE